MTTPPAVEPLFDRAAIEERVRALAGEIEQALPEADPLILGLLSGAEIFLADLVRGMKKPVRFEFVRVEVSAGSSALAIHYPIPLDVRGQDLLVVKDVVSTGVVETYLAQQLTEHGAASVRFVALVDLEEERKTSFAVDFRAFSLSRTGRLVGYGLKNNGRLGNLPFLARLT